MHDSLLFDSDTPILILPWIAL